jgi:hypothetical protein
MKKALTTALDADRQYRAVTARSKILKVTRYVISMLAAYMLIIIFPQSLFAHEISYRNFKVHAGEPSASGAGKKAGTMIRIMLISSIT